MFVVSWLSPLLRCHAALSRFSSKCWEWCARYVVQFAAVRTTLECLDGLNLPQQLRWFCFVNLVAVSWRYGSAVTEFWFVDFCFIAGTAHKHTTRVGHLSQWDAGGSRLTGLPWKVENTFWGRVNRVEKVFCADALWRRVVPVARLHLPTLSSTQT